MMLDNSKKMDLEFQKIRQILLEMKNQMYIIKNERRRVIKKHK